MSNDGGAARALDACLVRMLTEEPDRVALFANIAFREVHFLAANFAAHVAINLAKRPMDPQDKVKCLNNAANYLSILGKHEEALTCAKEATGLLEELTRARPEAFRPGLVGALNTLALRLLEASYSQKALTCARKAVKLSRELMKEKPKVFAASLALSLTNLGSVFTKLGRHTEALPYAEEAFRLHLMLVGERVETGAGQLEVERARCLAVSLCNLSAALSNLDRYAEALCYAQDGVKMYREMAKERRDAFTPEFATSLDNLVKLLLELHRYDAALLPAREVVAIRRELARAHSEVFSHRLAMSLGSLAKVLWALGRREEANSCAKEAVELARAHPSASPTNAGMSSPSLDF